MTTLANDSATPDHGVSSGNTRMISRPLPPTQPFSTAPRALKRGDVSAIRAALLYSSDTLTTGKGQLKFFPTTPNGERHIDNHTSNAFYIDGATMLRLLEVGFSLNAGALTFSGADNTAAIANAVGFINEMKNATFEMSVGADNCDLLHIRAEHFFNFEPYIDYVGSNTVVVRFKDKPLTVLPQDVQIKPGERYNLTLRFPLSAKMPASGSVVGVTDGDLRVVATVNVENWEEASLKKAVSA